MRVTLKTLAELSGLSTTTVSMILNGKEVRVSDENRQRVLSLARQYRYVPNSLAVGLVTKKTNTVGLILPDIANGFFSGIAKNLENALGERDQSLILCNIGNRPDDEIKYAALLLSKGVDALVACPSVPHDESKRYINSFLEQGKRVVVFDRSIDDAPCPTVSGDNLTGARNAVLHLVENGHRRIGCISGPLDSSSSKLRVEGYLSALEACGIQPDYGFMRVGDYKFEGGYNCGRELLRDRQVTALFVCNDLMAYGLYRAAKELHVSIPFDLSVVGYDDLEFSGMLDVPLSSVRQNTHLIAAEIVRLLDTNLLQRILLKNDLIKRSSVARIDERL